MGSDDDVAYYRKGVAELPSPTYLPDYTLENVTTAAFVDGVAFDLRRHDLRAIISAEGRWLFWTRRMATLLAPCLPASHSDSDSESQTPAADVDRDVVLADKAAPLMAAVRDWDVQKRLEPESAGASRSGTRGASGLTDSDRYDEQTTPTATSHLTDSKSAESSTGTVISAEEPLWTMTRFLTRTQHWRQPALAATTFRLLANVGQYLRQVVGASEAEPSESRFDSESWNTLRVTLEHVCEVGSHHVPPYCAYCSVHAVTPAKAVMLKLVTGTMVCYYCVLQHSEIRYLLSPPMIRDCLYALVKMSPDSSVPNVSACRRGVSRVEFLVACQWSKLESGRVFSHHSM